MTVFESVVKSQPETEPSVPAQSLMSAAADYYLGVAAYDEILPTFHADKQIQAASALRDPFAVTEALRKSMPQELALFRLAEQLEEDAYGLHVAMGLTIQTRNLYQDQSTEEWADQLMTDFQMVTNMLRVSAMTKGAVSDQEIRSAIDFAFTISGLELYLGNE